MELNYFYTAKESLLFNHQKKKEVFTSIFAIRCDDDKFPLRNQFLWLLKFSVLISNLPITGIVGNLGLKRFIRILKKISYNLFGNARVGNDRLNHFFFPPATVSIDNDECESQQMPPSIPFPTIIVIQK
ncbi:hypothetical protein LOAG_13963 [Loa loa]|uniref:Uncharacterized protein n=1 Tax=Loa loa TaxID=7209 RepID=A0A1S0TIH7_LOALO|nr:hypothetical protein LOAG_13963 [Loa loa]EFO14554.1 hypothetical protein LOAG_13963 [Loa loa]